jgi:two-component system CheB/CheR fusion protein
MKTARENGRAEDERFHLRKDGTRFYCSGILSPLVDNGVIYGYVKIARDLTVKQLEAVEHERQFVRVQADRVELQNVNRLKDSFLATLSHELRNPLNLILMQTEILRRSSKDRADPALDRATEIIAQNVKVQARLIDDLLDVSRLTTGKLALERQPLSFPAVVAESITALHADIDQKRITLDLALADEPLIVNGDAIRLRQIAWNLVSNAIKFTPPGGRIGVSVRRDGDEARLDVEDNGQGIPDAFMPHVFDLFSQHDSGAARRYSGMGIGLALVRQLTELQDGRVEAHSDGEGKGARFTVWIPLYEAPQNAPALGVSPERVAPSAAADVRDAHARMPRRLEGLRVLVVDDDASSAEALRELIEEEGAFVRAANGGAGALALAARYDFDVVISDIAMPDMDGYALLRALRENPRYAQVPAIACSGYASHADPGQARRAGFTTYLMKPLELERVVAAVRAAGAERARR